MIRDKILLVVKDEQSASGMRRLLADPVADVGIRSLREASPDFYVTYPGDALLGRRVSDIVVARSTIRAMKRDTRAWRWWRESVLCRLSPQGNLIELD